MPSPLTTAGFDNNRNYAKPSRRPRIDDLGRPIGMDKINVLLREWDVPEKRGSYKTDLDNNYLVGQMDTTGCKGTKIRWNARFSIVETKGLPGRKRRPRPAKRLNKQNLAHRCPANVGTETERLQTEKLLTRRAELHTLIVRKKAYPSQQLEFDRLTLLLSSRISASIWADVLRKDAARVRKFGKPS